MNRLVLVLLASTLILNSCNDSKSSDIKIVKELEISESGFRPYVDLQENKALIGNITSFSMLDNDSFVISDNTLSKLVIYDEEGMQLKVIEGKGDGPLEFNSCPLVKYFDGKIYLWSDKQLKLITFDKAGNPIEEFKMFDRAISNFMVYNDKVVMYTKGGFSDSFVHVYDLSSKTLDKSFGEVGNEQILLDIYTCSGGLLIKDDILSYMGSDKLNIHRYDMKKNSSLKSVPILDKEFEVQKIEMDAVDFVNSNFNGLIDFIHENSVVAGVYSLDDGYVVVSEVGKYKAGIEENELDNSLRYNKYYFLNDNFELDKIYKTKKSSSESPCLIESKDNKLYRITQNKIGESYALLVFTL